MKIAKVDLVDGGKNKKGKKLGPKLVCKWGCSCGREISSDYKFCPNCGKKVEFRDDTVIFASAVIGDIQEALVKAAEAFIAKAPKGAASGSSDVDTTPTQKVQSNSTTKQDGSVQASGDFATPGAGSGPSVTSRGPAASGDFVEP